MYFTKFVFTFNTMRDYDELEGYLRQDELFFTHQLRKLWPH